MPSLWRSPLKPMLRVPIGTSGQSLVFSRRVLKLFEECRQIAPELPEAGGQLFAKLAGNQILIQQATGPRPSDKRTRMHFVPDRLAEQREIARMHKDGLHYVGDWHTHPDAYPVPSMTDIQSIRECVLRSRHELQGFTMVVVGTGPVPESLHISVHDGKVHSVLKASGAGSPEAKTTLRKRVLSKLFKKS
jgi:integrative and conjugative element protein (TIGR02256 family)